MTSLAQASREALANAYDPCSQSWGRPMSLLDLGLVREVTAEAGVVTVRIGLTVPYCMAVATIMQTVETRVAELDGVVDVNVVIDQDAVWSPELMTQRARERLTQLRASDRLASGLPLTPTN